MFNLLSLLIASILLACLPIYGINDNKIFIIGGLVLLLGSLTIANYRDFKIKTNTISYIDCGVLFLLISCFIAFCASPFLNTSIKGLLKYVIYALYYICFLLLTKNQDNNKILLYSCLIGCFWVCLEGLNQVIFGAKELATWSDPSIPAFEKLNRVYSTLLNPNLLAAYLLPFWGLCFYFAYKAFTDEKNIIKTFLFSIFAFLIIYLISQTGSRGAWLALMGQIGTIGLLLFIYLRSLPIIFIMSFISISGIAYIFMKKAFLHRLMSIFTGYEDSSNSFRLHVWDACLKMFNDSIFFGIGPGSETFYLVYGAYMHSLYSSLGAYSLVLETAVETGLIGLTSLFILVIACIYSSLKYLKLAKHTKNKLFIIIIFSGLVGWFLSGLFDIVILRPQIQIYIYLWLAILRNEFVKLKENLHNN